MEQIGVRELRQNASRYLARVAAGEDFQITDRGRPVALLVPVPADPYQALLAAGVLLAPETDGAVLDEAPVDHGINASANLAELRDQER